MDYELDEVTHEGESFVVLKRVSDQKGIAMDMVDPWLDLIHSHPKLSGILMQLLFELREQKEFRAGVQA